MKAKFLNLRHFIPVIITGLILSSCSKDSTPTDNLVGTWTAGTTTFTATVNGKTMTQYFIDDMGLTATEAQTAVALFNAQMQQTFTGTIQMKADHTYTATLGGDNDTGTWSLSSDGKKLTIDSSTADPFVADIVELTSSKLHLQGTQTQNEDINGDGTNEAIVVTVDMNLTK